MQTLSDLIDNGIHKPTIRRMFVVVTPECAQKAIDRNHPENRPPQEPAISEYMQMMIRGEFMDNHPERLLFSDTGYLIDGQNRLNALIRCNKKYQMEIATGVPERFFPYLNAGKSRDMHDRLPDIEGPRQSKKILGEILRAWLFIRTGVTAKQSPYQMKALIKRWEPEIFDVVEYARKYKNKRYSERLAVAGCMAAALEAFRMYPMEASLFFKALPCQDVQENQPRRLQQYLLHRKDKNSGRGRTTETYLHTWVAIRAYVDGHEINTLRITKKTPKQFGLSWEEVMLEDVNLWKPA